MRALRALALHATVQLSIAEEGGQVTEAKGSGGRSVHGADGSRTSGASKAPFELRLPVAVQVERREPVSRWATASVVPVGVTPGAMPTGEGALLVAGERAARHHAGNAEIIVHRRDTEGVLANLSAPEPVVYVVMRPDGGAPLGTRLHLVTVSDHEAQDHTDAGEDEVARVPLPPALREPIEAFVALHHRDEPRRKRRRVEMGEAHRFGREPVWTLPEGTLTDDRLDRPRDDRPGRPAGRSTVPARAGTGGAGDGAHGGDGGRSDGKGGRP